VISTVALGFGTGFFFMFLQRELNLNEQLARARARTASAEGAANVVHELLNKLPTNLLTYVNDVSESVISKDEREEIRVLLYSKEVDKFLELVEERLDSGASLDWDSISKAAYIQYYKAYFEGPGSRDNQILLGEQWIQRALLIQPFHAALTIAYADLKALQKDYSSAAKIIRDLITGGDPPATAMQLLGYYLLETGQYLESIRYSNMYLELYPEDSITIFNLAYCYGRLFSGDRTRNDYRTECLRLLEKALAIDPGHVLRIRGEWMREGFQCFEKDDAFIALLAGAEARTAKRESAPNEGGNNGDGDKESQAG
jgi:tetratricopeptide (TPR) repeat protein